MIRIILNLLFFTPLLTNKVKIGPSTGDNVHDVSPDVGNVVGDDVTTYFTDEDFNNLFPNSNKSPCDGGDMYSYKNFLKAAVSSQSAGFLNSKDLDTNKRELAAFLAQASYESGAGDSLPEDQADKGGFCFWQSPMYDQNTYCDSSKKVLKQCSKMGYSCDCASGKRYIGRGPMQLRWNYNYAAYSSRVNREGVFLNDPDQMSTDPSQAFQAAIWYWLVGHDGNPSFHAIMFDETKSKDAGFGQITKIMNDKDCGQKGQETKASQSKINYYNRYLDYFGVKDSREKGCAKK